MKHLRFLELLFYVVFSLAFWLTVLVLTQPSAGRRAPAWTQAHDIVEAVDAFRERHERLPWTLMDLYVDGDLKTAPADRWGGRFDYTPIDSEVYQLSSPGPDGRRETQDDLRLRCDQGWLEEQD